MMPISDAVIKVDSKCAPVAQLGGPATVAVVIPAFNHARFLSDALTSVVAQTHPADEIIVVDDGSSDDPSSVVGKFPSVHLIRQHNRGLSAARNVGLRCCATSHVLFLDADDRLLPIAIEAGLAHAAKRPDCALVYGGFHVISEDGKDRGPDIYHPIKHGGYHDLLTGNICVPGAALARRECLIAVGGFDETLRGAADYDLYLRLARNYGIDGHPAIVAEYRRHQQNMSNNYRMMLRETLIVLDRCKTPMTNTAVERALLRKGNANWRDFFATQMLTAAHGRPSSWAALMLVAEAIWTSPRTAIRSILPPWILRTIRQLYPR